MGTGDDMGERRKTFKTYLDAGPTNFRTRLAETACLQGNAPLLLCLRGRGTTTYPK